MRNLIILIALFAATQLPATQAEAAALRTMTTLHSMNVYLRDLFDDAGKNADKLLGPGPDPGGRIVVEAPQLNAIARQFGVEWRSVSAADRAVLEWPGRPLKREDAIEAIRIAITASGAPDDSDIDVPGFSPPVVPFEWTGAPAVSQLDYDRSSGHFTAMLSITGDSMNPINARVSGQVEEMAEAPVALTRLLPETVLRADDVHMARIRVSQIRTQVAMTLDQIVGMALKRPVPAGQPLRLADLMKPPLVQRGATVQVQLEVSGLSVAGQAVAMEAGAEGDRIRVQNQNSRALLTAQVIGPGMVRVTPDVLPTTVTRYDHRIQP